MVLHSSGKGGKVTEKEKQNNGKGKRVKNISCTLMCWVVMSVAI